MTRWYTSSCLGGSSACAWELLTACSGNIPPMISTIFFPRELLRGPSTWRLSPYKLIKQSHKPWRQTNWLATGKQPGTFFTKFTWKILHTNLDLKGMVQGEAPLPGPCFPLLRSRFVYRIFHEDFPKKCPVALQWPDWTLKLGTEEEFSSRITSTFWLFGVRLQRAPAAFAWAFSLQPSRTSINVRMPPSWPWAPTAG